ncbi:hypothetical protein HELRODRAFT_98804 [Helobdella robusta]|uniref:SAM-dependent MTase RsmB/NOP-type domain-containing protein n=1 Tax=Helobdella robusta TaxID=6412 RepID=T1G9P9_HELRO|nr:hypothetical protein HELRODRAFT_98804 [Helobdella robusta]ESO06886.1 hypothetical protein HELRODRAFT_98804 [Helobdella robusta]
MGRKRPAEKSLHKTEGKKSKKKQNKKDTPILKKEKKLDLIQDSDSDEQDEIFEKLKDGGDENDSPNHSDDDDVGDLPTDSKDDEEDGGEHMDDDEEDMDGNDEPLDEFDDDSDDDDDEEEEVDSDNEELLPIERKARKLLQHQQENKRQADESLITNIVSETSDNIIQCGNEIVNANATSLVAVKQRMIETKEILSDFKNKREPGKKRKEYIEQLIRDLCFCYGYNEFLMVKLFDLFPDEIVEYLEAANMPRPETIRTNTLKTRRRDLAKALISRGVNVDQVTWSKVGLIVSDIKRTKDQHVTIGATPEYLAGHYMLQGASSFLPCMSLAPQENELVLDMAAAPGGKSTHLAQLMKNTGCLVVNDANKERVKAVVGNLHRMGVVNSVISNVDGRKLPKMMTGFDRVLLDAPCTGTGVVSKHPSVKVSKDEKDVQRCSHLQRDLLLAAIDCCNAKSSTGGYIVYSTCSVLVEENEAVVNFALKKRSVKIVETGLNFGTNGIVNFKGNRFHPSVGLCKRFYPHTHNLDGFFVCKLKKYSNKLPVKKTDEDDDEKVTKKMVKKQKINLSVN